MGRIIASKTVTTGRDRDPAAFGPQPRHVRLERYVPQSLLFPRCDLVVTHGGTGTVKTALGHGLPMIIVPVSADQPDNARRYERLRVATVVAADGRTPGAFRDAVRAVLGDPGYRRTAGELREEMARLPGPEQVVGWLEQLDADQPPATGAHQATTPSGVAARSNDGKQPVAPTLWEARQTRTRSLGSHQPH